MTIELPPCDSKWGRCHGSCINQTGHFSPTFQNIPVCTALQQSQPVTTLPSRGHSGNLQLLSQRGARTWIPCADSKIALWMLGKCMRTTSRGSKSCLLSLLYSFRKKYLKGFFCPIFSSLFYTLYFQYTVLIKCTILFNTF